MEKMVSVIIPIFNTDIEVVKRCLQSIRVQNYNNIEVIIVDDGSMSQYADAYDHLEEKRIRVYHQRNKGVSAARNKGIELANGEFITFVDADDYMAPFALERGVYLIEKENADMIIGAVEKITKENNIMNSSVLNAKAYVSIIGKGEYAELCDMCLNDTSKRYLNINGNGEILRGPVARIIRADVVKINPFPENIILGEDVIWNIRLLKKCRHICIDYNIWYYYVMNSDSAIHRYYGNRCELVTKYLQVLLEENPEIQNVHKKALIKNMAVEFYCILNYDWMSAKCLMSYKQKNKAAKNLLQQPIWKILKENYRTSKIPAVYKIFITLAKWEMWQLPLKIYNYLKTIFQITLEREKNDNSGKLYEI